MQKLRNLMIQPFIKIRCKQILRATNGLGLFRIIFLIGLFGIIVFGLFMQTAKTPNSYLAVCAYMMIIMMIQVKRMDKQFFKIHFINSKLILLMEYSLLVTPLFICLIFHKQWTLTISIIVLISLIVNVDFKSRQKSLNTAIQGLIPSSCFEWKSGVRKTLVLMFAFWIIGLGTSFFVGSIPVVLFILGIFPFTFYEKCEPIQMLLAYEKGTNWFLIHKIKIHIVLFTTLSIPLIIAFLLFHPDKWYIPVIEYFILINSHIYVILTKYAFFQPNSKSSGAQAFGLIGAIGMIIPVFIPLIWLLSIRFYFKSRENLNFYLNDYN